MKVVLDQCDKKVGTMSRRDVCFDAWAIFDPVLKVIEHVFLDPFIESAFVEADLMKRQTLDRQ